MNFDLATEKGEMMRRFLWLSVLLIVGSTGALATPITLTLTGLKNLEQINSYYNGGSGSLGSTGGPNYGIVFTSNSYALTSTLVGGNGGFTNVPLPATTTAAYFASGGGDTLDVASGFTTGFSFFYADALSAGSVKVYSGLDGTGALLVTILTPTDETTGCDLTGILDCWTNTGAAFAGTAESVVFTGAETTTVFADVTLGASSVPSSTPAVPEPGSFVLLGSGVLGLVGMVRRGH